MHTSQHLYTYIYIYISTTSQQPTRCIHQASDGQEATTCKKATSARAKPSLRRPGRGWRPGQTGQATQADNLFLWFFCFWCSCCWSVNALFTLLWQLYCACLHHGPHILWAAVHCMTSLHVCFAHYSRLDIYHLSTECVCSREYFGQDIFKRLEHICRMLPEPLDNNHPHSAANPLY